MKRLAIITMATGLSLLAEWLIAAPALISPITRVFLLGGSRITPSGRYLNVDAGYGSAELTFFENGRYTYGDEGSVSAEGTYVLSDDRITFVEYGPADAACLHKSALYRWTLTGGTLSLTNIEDACPTRAFDWQSGEWVEEQE